MQVVLGERAIPELAAAPPNIQKAFIKQINYLIRDVRHPSLRAKKFDERLNRWQARINDDWRFYFTIIGDSYRIDSIIPHPK